MEEVEEEEEELVLALELELGERRNERKLGKNLGCEVF